jgi:hypothetical protein
MSCWCPHCDRDIYVPLTKLDCPKCEEYYKAEIEHWKERYARIVASLNDGIKKIETKTFVNPAREMWLEYLIELRNSLED